jgi:hypothetical protein
LSAVAALALIKVDIMCQNRVVYVKHLIPLLSLLASLQLFIFCIHPYCKETVYNDPQAYSDIMPELVKCKCVVNMVYDKPPMMETAIGYKTEMFWLTPISQILLFQDHS